MLSGVLILPKFVKVSRCDEDEVRNTCSITARGCGETVSNRSDWLVSLPPCRVNNCCGIVDIFDAEFASLDEGANFTC